MARGTNAKNVASIMRYDIHVASSQMKKLSAYLSKVVNLSPATQFVAAFPGPD